MTKFSYKNSILGDTRRKIEILCIHGLGCSKENFIEIIKASQKKNINCISIDLPGFGNNNLILDDNVKTYEFFFKKLSLELSFSKNLIIILHSISSCLINELSTFIKCKSIILLEGNLLIDDAKWSEVISNMNEKKFFIYSNYLRLNYFEIMSKSILANISRNSILDYFANGNKFDGKSFYKLAKLGYKRTISSEISNLITNEKSKFLYIVGSRTIMNKTFDFVKSSKISYYHYENCGHYPMIEYPDKVIKAIESLR